MGCGASKNDLSSSSSENQQQEQEPQAVEVSNNKNEQSEEATTEKNSEEEKETIKEDDILVENMEGDDDDEAKNNNNANASTNILPNGNDSSSNGVDPLASIAGGNASSLGIPSLTTFPTVAVKASSGNNDGNENSISIGQSSTNSTSRKKLVADDIIMEDAFDVEDDVQQASSRRTASGIFGPRGTSSMRKGSSIVTTSLTSPTKVTASSSFSPTSNKPTSMRPGRLAANRPPAGSTMKNAVKMAGAAGANFGGFSAAPGRR